MLLVMRRICLKFITFKKFALSIVVVYFVMLLYFMRTSFEGSRLFGVSDSPRERYESKSVVPRFRLPVLSNERRRRIASGKSSSARQRYRVLPVSDGYAARTGNGFLTRNDKNLPAVSAVTSEKNGKDFKEMYTRQCGSKKFVKNLNTFQPLGFDIWLYSAYIDYRLPAKTFIRVIVLAKHSQILKRSLFCLFGHDSDRDEEDDLVRMSKYEMCENHNNIYGGFILSCSVPKKRESLCSVKILLKTDVSNKSCIVPLSVIPPLRNDDIIPKRYTFGVCLPPLFGTTSVNRLVEYIELHKLLGVEKFVMYKYDGYSNEVARVIENYVSQELIDLIPWSLPSVVRHRSRLWYHGQIIAINDCLYRTMNDFMYVSFSDLDEFLIPQNHITWNQLFSSLDSTNVSGYCFHSTFFNPSPKPSSSLITTSNYLRTKMTSSVRSKCVVIPERVFEKGIHHISKPVAHYKSLSLAPSIGVYHHYRNCLRNFHMDCKNYVYDFAVKKFAKLLEDNVKAAKSEAQSA
ncbi:uncharacterized protein LOC141915232 [Tubulanus polymorphus]|uniref:uncharacterized protein LOC141915232 n=1 Tax=Tubulanus polymorphus TaxID=672921 RepID=UPI003DA33FFE